MTQLNLQQLNIDKTNTDKVKTDKTDLTKSDLPILETSRPEDIILIELLHRIKKHRTTAPTHVPKDFMGQIEFYDDGSEKRTYKWINSQWVYSVDSTTTPGATYAIGYETRTSGAGTGTLEITTGFEPKLIKIEAGAGNFANYGRSNGHATTTSDYECLFWYYSSGWKQNKADYIIYLFDSSSVDETYATVSAIGATSFTLNFTHNDLDCNFLWEAWG